MCLIYNILNPFYLWKLYANLVEIGPVILEKIFKISSKHICYFVIIYSLKRAWTKTAWPFIETNLNPFTKGCFASNLDVLAL